MRLLAWSALAALLLDQLSKYLVIHVMALWRIRSYDVLPPTLNFRYGENRGINFGLGDGVSIWMLIVVACVIVLAVIIWAARTPLRRVAYLSAGLLVGGALANVLDRLIYGYVLDFLNMSCCGITNPFVFNVADIFIFAGAFGLIIFTSETKRSAKTTTSKSTKRGQSNKS